VESRPTPWRPVALGVVITGALAAALVGVVTYTMPVRRSVSAYTELLGAANRRDLTDEQRLALARRLCSARYLRTHELKVAPEGGLVGIPRNIHKNFQAWRQGPNVWICPTNRVGPIYQFVSEDRAWRFDGPVGLLRPHGEVVPFEEVPEGLGDQSSLRGVN
jgi:hypothetical protein